MKKQYSKEKFKENTIYLPLTLQKNPLKKTKKFHKSHKQQIHLLSLSNTHYNLFKDKAKQQTQYHA